MPSPTGGEPWILNQNPSVLPPNYAGITFQIDVSNNTALTSNGKFELHSTPAVGVIDNFGDSSVIESPESATVVGVEGTVSSEGITSSALLLSTQHPLSNFI